MIRGFGGELFSHLRVDDYPRRLVRRLSILYRRLLRGYHPERRYMRGRNSQ